MMDIIQEILKDSVSGGFWNFIGYWMMIGLILGIPSKLLFMVINRPDT